MKIYLNLIKTCILSFLVILPTTVYSQNEHAGGPQTDWASVSPDGDKVLFISNVGGSNDIWLSERDGSRAKLLLNWPNSDEKYPNWSPDGSSIIFTSNHDSPNTNIWTILMDGTNPTQLTSIDSNQMAKYSPNGQQIAFLSNRTGKRELWVMGTNGDNQKAVGLQSLRVSDLAWSPDNNRLVYVGCTSPKSGGSIAEASCNLFIITINASQTQQITFGMFDDWNPDWGFKGIVFESNRNSSSGLWLIKENGTNLEQVTNPLGTGDHHPKWDSVNDTILFTRTSVKNVGAVTDIWESDLAGNEKKITNLNIFASVGDFDLDGDVDKDDLNIMRSKFGSDATNNNFDINQDGVVNVLDFRAVVRLCSRTRCSTL
ncbi:MAG: hypothetical protein GQ532_14185 [Methylomarinum sp.]|nr:hypothetical protein [Methylomarinum sp.]